MRATLEKTLNEIDTARAELLGLLPLTAEQEDRFWKKLRLEWNYNSNHIEGNTLTYAETELIILFDQAPENGGHTVREIEEMKAHDVAVAKVREWAADVHRALSEADIRDLNRIILVRPFWKDALTPDGHSTRRLITVGEYKEHPNHVRLANGEMFYYASPEETGAKMGDLMAWYHDAAATEHPVVVAARLHYDFVRIHPFDDGNGRVARLLMNYHLLRHGYPPIIIRSADKRNYIAALNKADVGDHVAFYQYIAEQMPRSLDLALRAARGESVEEPGDWEKELVIMEKNIAKAEVPVEMNDETLMRRYEDSFAPLFILVDEKVKQFDRFFAEKKKIVRFLGLNQFAHALPKSMIEKANSIFHDGQLMLFDKVELYMVWEGMVSNTVPANTLFCTLQIEFFKYQYTISIQGLPSPLASKNYNHPLTPTEMEHITNEVGKFLLERLRQMQQ